jgi:uncharacterized protein YgiM (DUF1202 family)
MKKKFVFFILFLLVTGILFAQFKKGSSAWVSSKIVELKSSTSFFGRVVTTLQMGTEVTVLQVNGNWAEVQSKSNSSQKGWAAVSNLSTRRILASGSSASANEIALAGKGFSQEVENAYKAEGNLDYADVDRTEAITVSKDDLYKFVVDGHLITGE